MIDFLSDIFSGPYFDMYNPRPTRFHIPREYVRHQETCPECVAKLVNLYHRGSWKCKKCHDKEKED